LGPWGSERSGEEYVFRAEAIRCIIGGAIFGAFPLAYSPATTPSDLPSAFFKHLLNTKTNRETARAALRVGSIFQVFQKQSVDLGFSVTKNCRFLNTLGFSYFLLIFISYLQRY
jgi:hypothetical protein